MQPLLIPIDISFTGNEADNAQLEFYDLAKSLLGFQRSLAIATHLTLNGEVITQAPSLKSARIYISPPEEGSWKARAFIGIALATGAYKVTTAPSDTPLGHLVYSAYDYIINTTLGFHVDFEQSLLEVYHSNQELKKLPEPNADRFASAIEKCETAISDMHRPMTHSESATSAEIIAPKEKGKNLIGRPLDKETFENIQYIEESDRPSYFFGFVTSFNTNTYRGRFYSTEQGRPLPFDLSADCRNYSTLRKITESLNRSIERKLPPDEKSMWVKAFYSTGRTGLYKHLYIIEVGSRPG